MTEQVLPMFPLRSKPCVWSLNNNVPTLTRICILSAFSMFGVTRGFQSLALNPSYIREHQKVAVITEAQRGHGDSAVQIHIAHCTVKKHHVYNREWARLNKFDPALTTNQKTHVKIVLHLDALTACFVHPSRGMLLCCPLDSTIAYPWLDEQNTQ